MPNLQQYMTIKGAAEYLGVTPNTLRNWGATGKIPEYRHPANNYRLYKSEDLDEFLNQIEKPAASRRRRVHRSKKRAR